jgi:hypothetical protein
MEALTLIDEALRGDAARIARRVIERGAEQRLSNPALKFLLAETARALAPEAAGPGPYPARLRAPVFHVLLDAVQRTLPLDATELGFPPLRAELEATPFAADDTPARKYFRLVDGDGVPLSGVIVGVMHGTGAIAQRKADANGEVDVSDLPGTRLTVIAPPGAAVRQDGQLHAERVIRVEEGDAGAVRRRTNDQRWSEDGYLEGATAGSPLAELRLGATDEAGADAYALPPTVYAGWVTQLQHDLRRLGHFDCPADGHFGLQTAGFVRAFQDEASRCPHRIGRITYHGPIDGVAHLSTREEIARWLEEGSTRHAARLGTRRMTRIIRAAVRAVEPAGVDPYAFIGEHPEGGTLYGIGKFIQRRGDVGDLLARFFFSDAALFDHVFGSTGRQLMLELCEEESDVRCRTALAKRWRAQLLAAAGVPAWRAEQEALTRVNAFEPVLDVARAHGIVHERGLAMLYRTNVRAGIDDVENAAAAIGRRPAGVAPDRHYRDAIARIRKVDAIAHELPILLRELETLAGVGTGFDDCEELWWGGGA